MHLDLTPIGKEQLAEKLSDISSFVRIYLGLDTATDPIPVKPTCHYMMGGIPTNIDGAVLDENGDPVPGLYAAGECSCISLHGANRLGCNSLVDLVVFGRRAGKLIAQDLRNMDWQELPDQPNVGAALKLEKLKERRKGEKAGHIRALLQKLMSEQCSVFRNERGLREALSELRSLKERYEAVATRRPWEVVQYRYHGCL